MSAIAARPAGGVGTPPGRAAPPKRRRRLKPQAPVNVQPTVECEPGRWTITFPAPATMMSVNSGHQHWRKTGPLRKIWRETMFTYAQFAKLPRGLDRVRIDLVLRFPRSGRQDVGNYYTHVVKPIVDGLGPPIHTLRAGKMVNVVGYGLIADDTVQYLDGPYPLLGEPIRDKAAPYGQVTVTITKVDSTCSTP